MTCARMTGNTRGRRQTDQYGRCELTDEPPDDYEAVAWHEAGSLGRCAGLTQFPNKLVSLFEPHLDNPDVLVTLESGATNVIVSGFANRPGKYSFDRPTTVYQAIMEAGGVSDYGSLRNIHLTRIINGEQRSETVNLRPAIRGEPTKPKYVQDGDVIYISRSLF